MNHELLFGLACMGVLAIVSIMVGILLIIREICSYKVELANIDLKKSTKIEFKPLVDPPPMWYTREEHGVPCAEEIRK